MLGAGDAAAAASLGLLVTALERHETASSNQWSEHAVILVLEWCGPVEGFAVTRSVMTAQEAGWREYYCQDRRECGHTY